MPRRKYANFGMLRRAKQLHGGGHSQADIARILRSENRTLRPRIAFKLAAEGVRQSGIDKALRQASYGVPININQLGCDSYATTLKVFATMNIRTQGGIDIERTMPVSIELPTVGVTGYISGAKLLEKWREGFVNMLIGRKYIAKMSTEEGWKHLTNLIVERIICE